MGPPAFTVGRTILASVTRAVKKHLPTRRAECVRRAESWFGELRASRRPGIAPAKPVSPNTLPTANRHLAASASGEVVERGRVHVDGERRHVAVAEEELADSRVRAAEVVAGAVFAVAQRAAVGAVDSVDLLQS